MIGELSQLDKKWFWVGALRRNTHQAGDRQAACVATISKKLIQLFWRNAGLFATRIQY